MVMVMLLVWLVILLWWFSWLFSVVSLKVFIIISVFSYGVCMRLM